MTTRLHLKMFFMVSLLLISIPTTFALTIDSPLSISHNVTIQPIILSDTNGSNTAEFFGDSIQQSIIEGLINQIWAQAGIAVNFLTANNWKNTFANWGAGGAPDNNGNIRPTSDLRTIVSDGARAGVTHSNNNVINMFFVNIPAGFDKQSEGTAAGLAFVGGNGITQYVGSNLSGFSGGQEVIASVVSHEIGHNLGLRHTRDGLANLMSSSGTSEQLSNAQIDIALSSRFSVAIAAVPVPAAFWLFGSAILLLFRVRKNQTTKTCSAI